MKILSPLSSVGEVLPLIDAGAEELYCGVVTPEWEKRFSYIASINLRHDKAANFCSFEQLAEAVKIASSSKTPIFCAFNANFYTEKQLPLVLKQAENAVEAGVSKLIVSDLGFISMLKQNGFPIEIALSTGNPVFNSASLEFFKSFGIKRIVLPRHLTVEEICAIAKSAKKLNIELEAFVLNAICPYIDGLCTLQHIGKDSAFIKAEELACRMQFEVEVLSNQRQSQKRAAAAKAGIWQNTAPEGCGLCALPFFKEAGIKSLKIAGRGNSLEKKIADVKMLREALSMLGRLDKKDFREEMKRNFFASNHMLCDFKSCYYAYAGVM